MKIVAVIPARYGSSRFPGKPLATILEKPMIQWVYERVSQAEGIDSTFVATDDERIRCCVESFGGKAIMTGECSCGTERVYEAIKDYPCDIVVNIQGDEPAIEPKEIEKLLEAFDDKNVVMATLKKRITENIDDPNVVKVITDSNDNALYFSRSVIPYNGRSEVDVEFYRHVGIYGYTKEFLKAFVDLKPSIHEKIEKLEQLRALDNGYRIKVVETFYESVGVDVKDDITKVEEVLRLQI